MDGQVSFSDGVVSAASLWSFPLQPHPSSDAHTGSDPGSGLAKCDGK